MIDAIVVGGGVSGLTAALRLSQRAARVTLFESEVRFGGKIGTTHEDGFLFERGADSFLSRKPRGIALCRELGLASRLVGRNKRFAKSFVLRGGELHRLPEGLTGLVPTDLGALRESSLLDLESIERVAAEREVPPLQSKQEESVAGFMTRRFGAVAFRELIEPLVGGIYAGRAEELSIDAIYPELRALELEHGSLTSGFEARKRQSLGRKSAGDETAAGETVAPDNYPPFVSFESGMQVLIDALQARLGDAQMVSGTEVIRVSRSGDTFVVSVRSGDGSVSEERSRAILLTAPLSHTARIVDLIDHELSGRLMSVPYASSVVIHAAFSEPVLSRFHGSGYLVPAVEERPVLACTWSSNKWDRRSPDGGALLRLYVGRHGDDGILMTDSKLTVLARAELADSMGIHEEPSRWRIVRHEKAIPQLTLGHKERIDSIGERLGSTPGLFLAGAAFGGPGIPDCIASAESAADEVARYLKLSPRRG